VIEPPHEKLFSPVEAAKILGVTEGRIYQLLQTGQMAGKKLGIKNWVIPASAIRTFLDKPKVGRPRSRTPRPELL